MASLKKSDARRILRRCARGRIAYVYAQGHRWVEDVFKPALRILEGSRDPHDKDLAAEASYVLGDVHHFNGAPRAAIRAYRRCLRIDPTASGAWRELGGMHSLLGEKTRALRALHRGLELNPGDEDARIDLSGVEDGDFVVYSGKHWRGSERMALGRFKEALEVLGRPQNNLDLQTRARIHGAMGLTDRVQKAWTRIASRRGAGIKLEGEDWYFLPRDLFDSPAWWRMLRRIKRVWPRSTWGFPELLWDLVPESAGRRRLEKVAELWVRYQLARVEKDLVAATRLARRYPRWKDAVLLAGNLRRLSSASRLP